MSGALYMRGRTGEEIAALSEAQPCVREGAW